jgi:hypothetical protein
VVYAHKVRIRVNDTISFYLLFLVFTMLFFIGLLLCFLEVTYKGRYMRTRTFFLGSYVPCTMRPYTIQPFLGGGHWYSEGRHNYNLTVRRPCVGLGELATWGKPSFYQCWGSVTFWYGSGSADPDHSLTLRIRSRILVFLVSCFQDTSKKYVSFLLISF